MSKRILFQFDSDSHCSTFDSVVAIDSDIDHLVPVANVQATSVEPLVHGTMFTRGGDDLKHTAIFIGGSDVAVAETLLRCVTDTFFGPVRVSVMMDANGCNTTAAAAVVCAGRHVDLAGAKAIVLGGTGPVGQRVGKLLAADGADVVLTSRSKSRAESVCQQIAKQLESDSVDGVGQLSAAAPTTSDELQSVLDGAQIVIACGAAGVQLASRENLAQSSSLRVAIDLNAVPPAGLEGIEVFDKAKGFEGTEAVAYGAIGVGGLKMKTHKAAIRSLFESNDKVLNASEIYALAKLVDAS
ncbi:NADP-dependent methylenetetrahydromethanopterin/methylenetetrahydrofolate dehydrogenase [Rhodopirellula sp. MGV]|uniref:NADP-dependent methylenetetrahydromethanopterin/methylenetetrahydrofolate dehydrogenase n=1 Tax=Rhodopirellula sp. MGV TaxID=2023130 RepID=UPI000B969CB4|nr:NADP-dependent methylenetetrahydromethanopterin/methylenetetrahydrofolate dehydrogenase [Rhodopirellula sp. MGV]OYP28283.1 bifunctional NADP-dependent methylenetetrahydromethanopterin dehydrogenase/methylenetetrahydrofolate dehydrogenase [Rhodopirellula sp. MGV]PNY38839.1 bifunctional NADP-dependent methylenetetrahydromethanopterin dehydrogenase/methylenetetrahydrofolate dehydrogenase [Rhodopirellula baltica]